MRNIRLPHVVTSFFALSLMLTLASGCGESGPKTGEQGNAVNLEQGKAQGAAIKDAMKSKMKPETKKK